MRAAGPSVGRRGDGSGRPGGQQARASSSILVAGRRLRAARRPARGAGPVTAVHSDAERTTSGPTDPANFSNTFHETDATWTRCFAMKHLVNRFLLRTGRSVKIRCETLFHQESSYAVSTPSVTKEDRSFYQHFQQTNKNL